MKIKPLLHYRGKTEKNPTFRRLVFSLFILLTGAATVSAREPAAPDSKITVTRPTMSVEEVIRTIEAQTEYLVVFSNNDMDTKKTVSLPVGETTVSEILTRALSGTDIDYVIDNKYIVLKKRAPGTATEAAPSRNREIKGTVRDELGSPLIGVSIFVKDVPGGTVSDRDGAFTIRAGAGDRIVFSYLGYQTQEIQPGERTVLQVVLQEDVTQMESIVVTGFGNFKKSTYTGAATVVDLEKLQDIPAISTSQMLEAQVPGLRMITSSGQEGSFKTMRIRGTGSINASSAPLIVLDGVPIMSHSYSLNDDDDRSGFDPLSTINPNDIETITVLKDATSTSLYGARGSNGVILITTKKGAEGRTRLSFKAALNFSDFAMKFRPVMGGQERRELIYEGYVNEYLEAGETQSDAIAYADREIDRYAAVPAQGWSDWKDAMFHQGHTQNYDISISGGNANTTFAASLGYVDNKGISLSAGFERYTGKLTLEHKYKNFDFGMNTMFSVTESRKVSEDYFYGSPIFGITTSLTPSTPIYNTDGTYATGYGFNDGYNPLFENQETDKYNKVTRFLGSVRAGWQIIDELKLSSILGVDYSTTRDFLYWSPDSFDGRGTTGAGMLWTQTPLEVTSNTKLVFDKTLSQHHINATAAFEVRRYSVESTNMRANSYSQKVNTGLSNASTPVDAGQSLEDDNMMSIVGFLNYDYRNKYYFSGSFRRDGSSRLAADHRWGNFWSLSGSWRVTEEPFMKSTQNWLTDLKVKASYGVNGNLPTTWYRHSGQYTASATYGDLNAIRESVKGNERLTWEMGYNANIGIDLTLFNRVGMEINLYQRDTKDLLMDMPLYGALGFYSQTYNIGHLRNRGFEIDIRSENMRKEDFRWNSSLNLSTNRSKVVKTTADGADIIQSTNFIRRVGEAWNTIYVREYAGVDPQTGRAQYYKNTVNSDGTINRDLTNVVTEAERVAGKDLDPKLSGSLSNTFTYKFIDLSFMFSFSLGGHTLDIDTWAAADDGLRPYYNKSIELSRRWQKPGDVTDVPRYVNGNTNGGWYTTTRGLHSSNHLRLKNLSLGVRLPQQWLSSLGMQSARIYFAGSNLLTWAKYDLYDPELGPLVGIGIPPLKSFSFGIELSF